MIFIFSFHIYNDCCKKDISIKRICFYIVQLLSDGNTNLEIRKSLKKSHNFKNKM